MMNEMLAVCAGVALASACGFRVFVPLFVAALAVRAGLAAPVPSLAWIGSDLAIGMLGIATVVEIVAYYVPWLDHALDTVATPAAVVAGTLSVGVFAPGTLDPALQWAMALIVGGGSAGIVQAGTVLTRTVSGGTTLGLANPVVATVENAGAITLAGLAVFLPVLGAFIALLMLLLIVFGLRKLISVFRARRATNIVQPTPVVQYATVRRVPPPLPDAYPVR